MKVVSTIDDADYGEILELLIKCGAQYETLLLDAFLSDNIASVELLLRYGINFADEDSLDLVFFNACVKGSKEMIELLLKYGKFSQYCLNSSLRYACNSGFKEIVKLLTPDTEAKNRAIWFTMMDGNAEILEYLLSDGTKATGSHLILAFRENHTKSIEVLIKHGADVDVIDYDFGTFTPLIKACSQSNFSIVKMLLLKGAVFNLSDCAESTDPLKVKLTFTLCTNTGREVSADTTPEIYRVLKLAHMADTLCSAKGLFSVAKMLKFSDAKDFYDDVDTKFMVDRIKARYDAKKILLFASDISAYVNGNMASLPKEEVNKLFPSLPDKLAEGKPPVVFPLTALAFCALPSLDPEAFETVDGFIKHLPIYQIRAVQFKYEILADAQMRLAGELETSSAETFVDEEIL